MEPTYISLEHDTQYNEMGERFKPERSLLSEQLTQDWQAIAPHAARVTPLSLPIQRMPSLPYTVECIKYRNTLQGQWYSSPREGALRISLGLSSGSTKYFIVITRFENGDWTPISHVFQPDLHEGPYDIFIPPTQLAKLEEDEEFNLDLLLDAIQTDTEEES